MLKRLEGMGYINRKRDSEDERLVRVSITDPGRAIFAQALCGLDAIAEATGLAPEEFSRMQQNLVMLRDNLLRAAEERR